MKKLLQKLFRREEQLPEMCRKHYFIHKWEGVCPDCGWVSSREAVIKKAETMCNGERYYSALENDRTS
jgi:hypothetical protein